MSRLHPWTSQLSPALSHVRVADDPDRNLLFIAEELPELAQERNQGTLTKGVRHRSMERDGRALLRQLTDPPLGDPGRDKIDLVENVNEVLVLRVVSEVLADHLALGSRNVTSVNDVKDDVRTVKDLVQLSPDTARLALEEEVVALLVHPINALS